MKKLVIILASIVLGNLACVAQSFPWNVPGDDSGFQYNMNICGIVKIDNVEQSSLSLAVGAFFGDECRGAVYPYEFDGHVEYWITILGDTPGETLTFKLYDAASNTVLDLDCTCSVDFEIDALIGLDEHFIFSFTTPAPQPTIFDLPITGYGNNLEPGNYKLISSPIGEISASDVENLMTNDYDLYYFDQAGDNPGNEPNNEWINMHEGGTLELGKGYLYANSENITLHFTGTPYTGEATFPLDYSTENQSENMRGWNLVGNPFGTTATINFDEFYVMNEGGTNLIESSGQIDIMQGVFVKATASGQNVVFTAGGSTDGGEKIVLNVLKDRGNAIDRAVVRLAGNSTLPKFMLNPEATKIYIEQGGDDYAVVSSNEDEIPVSFKAASNGTYNLNVAVQNAELDYLHLIDNLAGTDTDLLANPNYTFEANTGDYASRFTLVLRNTTGLVEHFAFFNGHNWTVSNQGEATLQVIDVTGRLVSTKTIDGTTQLDINAAPGVYMFRLVNGSDVKVQKVIVR